MYVGEEMNKLGRCVKTKLRDDMVFDCRIFVLRSSAFLISSVQPPVMQAVTGNIHLEINRVRYERAGRTR